MARKAAPEEWRSYALALGLKIQKRRLELGLTQEQTAYAAGLTRSHFQQLERGLSRLDSPANPSLISIVAIAQVLQTDAQALLPPNAPDMRAGR